MSKKSDSGELRSASALPNGDPENPLLRETISFLALSLLDGVSYGILRKIFLSGLSFEQILKIESSTEFLEYLRKAGYRSSSQQVEGWPSSRDELWSNAQVVHRKLLANDVRLIHSDESDFPQRLRDIPDPPGWLFVQGNVSALHQPSLALVGTRDPSEDGIFLANYVGALLGYFDDAVTVSGLAAGIDSIIHMKSIRFCVPTIAFLGTGILYDYPIKSNGSLRHRICDDGGAVVSEYLPFQKYSKQNFVHRNRLQAGLANVVIPIEWREQSGTAHTVRFAHKFKRPIICLRLPDWSEHRELNVGKKMGASIFTIPGKEMELISTIRLHLKKKVKHPTTPSKSNTEQQLMLGFELKPKNP